MGGSVDAINAELRSLKKQLYTFQLKGMQLQAKARQHFKTHRIAAQTHINTGNGNEIEDVSNPLNVDVGTFGTESTPLCNEYILEMIAGHLPLPEVRKCRLVCKLWSLEMERETLKRKSVILTSDDEDFVEVEKMLRDKRLGNALNLSTIVGLEIPVASKIFQDVIESFGSTLSGLKLDECWTSPQEFCNILKKVPYLETLTVKWGRLISDTSLLDHIINVSPSLALPYMKKLNWDESQPICALERLIDICPNLVDLSVSCLGIFDPNQFNEKQWNSLKVLKLSTHTRDNEFDVSHFDALERLNLKLQNLSVRNLRPGGKMRMKQLSKFLGSVGETLVELSLNRSRFAHVSKIVYGAFVYPYSPFPVQLQHLKILRVDPEFFNSLSFLDDLPSLEQFECPLQNWRNWWSILFKHKLPTEHKSLTSVNLGAVDSECLQKILLLTPNLQELEVLEERFDDTALRTVCQHGGKLRSLKVVKILSGDERQNAKVLQLTDYGFTGLKPEDYPKEQNDSITSERLPYIGNLKDLHELDISTSYDTSISDAALLYGIRDLKNLCMLTLPKCKVTNSASDSLPSSMPHSKWIVDDSDGSIQIIGNQAYNLLNTAAKAAVAFDVFR